MMTQEQDSQHQDSILPPSRKSQEHKPPEKKVKAETGQNESKKAQEQSCTWPQNPPALDSAPSLRAVPAAAQG